MAGVPRRPARPTHEQLSGTRFAAVGGRLVDEFPKSTVPTFDCAFDLCDSLQRWGKQFLLVLCQP